MQICGTNMPLCIRQVIYHMCSGCKRIVDAIRPMEDIITQEQTGVSTCWRGWSRDLHCHEWPLSMIKRSKVEVTRSHHINRKYAITQQWMFISTSNLVEVISGGQNMWHTLWVNRSNRPEVEIWQTFWLSNEQKQLKMSSIRQHFAIHKWVSE